jgi:hypothetical protein
MSNSVWIVDDIVPSFQKNTLKQDLDFLLMLERRFEANTEPTVFMKWPEVNYLFRILGIRCRSKFKKKDRRVAKKTLRTHIDNARVKLVFMASELVAHTLI